MTPIERLLRAFCDVSPSDTVCPVKFPRSGSGSRDRLTRSLAKMNLLLLVFVKMI